MEDNETSRALTGIMRGAWYIIIGIAISTILSLFTKIIIARFYNISEYGIYGIVFTIINIAVVIAALGLPSYIPREIAYYSKRDVKRKNQVISASILTVFLSSVLLTIIILASSTQISIVFNSIALNKALKLSIIALPTIVLSNVIISVSRGLGRIREAFYYQYIVYYLAYFILVSIGGLLKLPIIYVFASFVTAQAINFIFLVLNAFKYKILMVTPFPREVVNELFKYSLPLLITSILGLVLNWTDTLMLGYFHGPVLVGYYKAAAPIARFLPVFLLSFNYMYLPIATDLFSSGSKEELRRVFQVLEKWIFLLTFPFFTLIFVYPRATIGFLFGEKYLPAAFSLQILSIGFMTRAVLGLNSPSLIVIKDTRFIAFSNLSAAVLNIFLNYILIPMYGINGAAIATSFSFILAVSLNSIRFYKKTGIHPFSKALLKPLFIGIILVSILYFSNVSAPSLPRALAILFLFFFLYFSLVLLSGSIEKEDIVLFEKLEKKVGINLSLLKRFLKHFLH